MSNNYRDNSLNKNIEKKVNDLLKEKEILKVKYKIHSTFKGINEQKFTLFSNIKFRVNDKIYELIDEVESITFDKTHNQSSKDRTTREMRINRFISKIEEFSKNERENKSVVDNLIFDFMYNLEYLKSINEKISNLNIEFDVNKQN